MPQAVIVIDKFHIVRMANDCLETVRKKIRSSFTNKQHRGLMHDRFILLKRETNLKGLNLTTLGPGRRTRHGVKAQSKTRRFHLNLEAVALI